VRIDGDTERRVLHDPEIWADDVTPDYGALGDAKQPHRCILVYDPTSPSPGIRDVAILDMDQRLGKYAMAIADPNSPAKVLEITTNDPGVAAFVEERMRVLEIPGYVRLEPWEPHMLEYLVVAPEPEFRFDSGALVEAARQRRPGAKVTVPDSRILAERVNALRDQLSGIERDLEQAGDEVTVTLSAPPECRCAGTMRSSVSTSGVRPR